MSLSSIVDWNWYQFQQLEQQQLYDLLKLRQDIFILEQQCLYPDIDDLDPKCLHLLGYEHQHLVAYLRLIPAEFHQPGNISFGRIISVGTRRGTGVGIALMQQAMNYVVTNYPQQDIEIGAQSHLQAFYEKFGFKRISEPYDDDGIMHIKMLFEAGTDHQDE